MEKKNSCARAGFSTILRGVVAILLCATPSIWADVTVPAGDVNDIDYTISGSLYVEGTANLLTSAYIEGFVNAWDNSVVNIKGGAVGWWIEVVPTATVTLYGTDFFLDTNGNGIKDPGEIELVEGSYSINGIVAGFYENGDRINLEFNCAPGATITLAAPDSGVKEVTIDIKPGSYPNTINLGSNGVIPVAILSDPDFDATTVDPESVSLAGSGVAVRGKGNKYLAHEEDVNGDGLTDLVVKVETENLNLPDKFQEGYGIVTGQTSDGVEFTGSDYIIIVPPEG